VIHTHTRVSRTAAFAVLIGTTMPAIFTEIFQQTQAITLKFPPAPQCMVSVRSKRIPFVRVGMILWLTMTSADLHLVDTTFN
jgi:hypothetical protein